MMNGHVFGKQSMTMFGKPSSSLSTHTNEVKRKRLNKFNIQLHLTTGRGKFSLKQKPIYPILKK